MTAILVDLDALGDTRPLWDAWLADAARVLPPGCTRPAADRAEAAGRLDAEAGNWRTLLERYAEDRAPVFLRPAAEVNAALRRLAATGVTVGVFTDAPEELARVALSQLGAARRVAALTAGADALARLQEALGDGTVVRTRAELVSLDA
jgi:phosphoglycolate phosphatase-like HAD superfamily hydrolase